MNSIVFHAMEYQSDGSFQKISYRYEGSTENGWSVYRNQDLFLELGPGYVLIESRYCGICATDIDRRFLPYPLPQVIGHEVTGYHQNRHVVVEINASHSSRGHQANSCAYCRNKLETHCPQRVTLGIDRLPGGFGPYFLAPQHGVFEIPSGLSPVVASVTEPLAAALQALSVSPPEHEDSIAVLGPGRLGLLLISALFSYRKRYNKVFKITAVGRRHQRSGLCYQMGADDFRLMEELNSENRNSQFDIVFDTTGAPSGFDSALNLSRRIVHLKSTNGQEVMGLTHLTDMVVDEIALLPFSAINLQFRWKTDEKGESNNIYLSPGVNDEQRAKIAQLIPKSQIVQGEASTILGKLKEPAAILKKHTLPQFDLAVVSCLAEADQVIRPIKGDNRSLVKPRGAMLLLETNDEQNNLLANSILTRGIAIHSSRCGNFRHALQILEEGAALCKTIEQQFITHRYPVHQIEDAFQKAAKGSAGVKVVIELNNSR